MIALAIVACSKEVETIREVSEGKKTIRLDIEPYEVLTKNTGAHNLDAKAMDSINILEAFIFKEDGSLELYRRFGNSEIVQVGLSNLQFEITPGKKHIYAVANSKNAWAGVTTLDKFLKVPVYLQNERFGYFTMAASTEVDISESITIRLKMRRLVSKIVVNGIKTKFAGTPYEGMSLRSARIYLTNVYGSKTYIGEDLAEPKILNKGKDIEADVLSTQIPGAFSENIHTPVGDTGYDTPQYFYCYENMMTQETPDRKFTRLVLEAVLDGKTYYYPVDINQPGYGWTSAIDHKGIKRGTIYTYNFVITGPGSDDPEKKITFKNITLNASVESFTTIPNYIVHF